MSITILQTDETESGPRIRKSLRYHHNIEANPIRTIEGLITRAYTEAGVTLFSYVRPSNGETLYLLEAELFFPPDIGLWRSYVLSGPPSDEQVKEIVAKDLPKGSVLEDDQ